jgi:probable phosphoglycerate mutase
VQHYPSGTRFPGGETLGEVQMRAVAALDGLREQHPKAIIAAVAHADLLKLVIAYYIGMHIDLFQRLVIDPASVTAISFSPMGPRMLAYNYTGSLDYLKPKPEEPPAQETETNNTETQSVQEATESPPVALPESTNGASPVAAEGKHE